jgi:hypothetical protein
MEHETTEKIKQFGKHYAKLDLMRHRLDFFTNESAAKGIDFVVKTASGKYHDISVQAINLERDRGIKIEKILYKRELRDNLLCPEIYTWTGMYKIIVLLMFIMLARFGYGQTKPAFDYRPLVDDCQTDTVKTGEHVFIIQDKHVLMVHWRLRLLWRLDLNRLFNTGQRQRYCLDICFVSDAQKPDTMRNQMLLLVQEIITGETIAIDLRTRKPFKPGKKKWNYLWG